MFCTVLLTTVLSLGNLHQTPQKVESQTIEKPIKRAANSKAKKLFRKSRANQVATDDTSYRQNHTPIPDVKDFLQAHGSTLLDIELTNADDDLIQTVKDNCPNLQVFSLQGGSNFMIHLTDTGVQTIGSFPQLSKLEFILPVSFDVTASGIQAMLTAQTGLQELVLNGFVDDNCLNTIAQYATLTKLDLTSYDVTSAGLEAFVQSSSMIADLTSLKFTGEAAFTDTFLQGLTQYTKLSELQLIGGWKAAKQTIVTLLQSLTNLTSLNLRGFKVTSVVAAAIGQLTQLTELSLSNCSKLGNYKTLLRNLTNLQQLSLGNATKFSYKHCHIVAKMSLRELSISGSGWMFNDGLNTLCKSKTLQANLESFTLVNAPSIDNLGFAPLSKLKLKTLCLQNCPFFNDTSMSLVMKGNLAKSLEALELEKVFISDASVALLANCPNLSTLMLAENNALTIDGMKSFLQLKTLWKSLTKLYLGLTVITKDMIPSFGVYENISTLVIGDALELDFFSDGPDFFKLPNVVKNHTSVLLFLGPLMSYDAFAHSSWNDDM